MLFDTSESELLKEESKVDDFEGEKIMELYLLEVLPIYDTLSKDSSEIVRAATATVLHEVI